MKELMSRCRTSRAAYEAKPVKFLIASIYGRILPRLRFGVFLTEAAVFGHIGIDPVSTHSSHSIDLSLQLGKLSVSLPDPPNAADSPYAKHSLTASTALSQGFACDLPCLTLWALAYGASGPRGVQWKLESRDRSKHAMRSFDLRER